MHAGETLVQAYSLTGAVPGKFAPVAGTDVKYASISADCATGQPIQSHADKRARATSTEFTILSLTANLVEGKVTLTFEVTSKASVRRQRARRRP